MRDKNLPSTCGSSRAGRCNCLGDRLRFLPDGVASGKKAPFLPRSGRRAGPGYDVSAGGWLALCDLGVTSALLGLTPDHSADSTGRSITPRRLHADKSRALDVSRSSGLFTDLRHAMAYI